MTKSDYVKTKRKLLDELSAEMDRLEAKTQKNITKPGSLQCATCRRKAWISRKP